MADEFTLFDYQQTATPITKAVVKTWREASPILDMLKFKTTSQLSEEVLRFNDLPDVGWRKIGESFVQAKIEATPIKERVYFMGAKIDIPREYVKAASIVDNRALQSEAQVKGIAFNFNTAFFLNNDQGSVDLDAIVGIHHRIHNDLGSAQKFDANLDVSDDTAVTSWYHKMFDKVDDLLDRVDGNPGDKVIFTGRTMYHRIQSALRQSNQLFSAELAGRQYMTYGQGGPKIVQAGYKVDQSTQILADAENGTALTGGTDSSIYCVRFGEPYLAGFCQEMPNAEDKGETEDGVNLRTIVRFSPGIYFSSPRAMAAAYGWTAA